MDLAQAFFLMLELSAPIWGIFSLFGNWGLIFDNFTIMILPMIIAMAILGVWALISLLILDPTLITKVLALISFIQIIVILISMIIMGIGVIAGGITGIFGIIGIGVVANDRMERKCKCIGQPNCECA